jgi:hypothetical protein
MICGAGVTAGVSSALGLADVTAGFLTVLVLEPLEACAKIGADTGANANSRRSTADRRGMMQEIYQFSSSYLGIQDERIEFSIKHERFF